jgi:V/A-type H+-transporting ATPase subunit A
VEVKTKKSKDAKQGVLKRIAGPVVTAVNLDAHMYDVVKVGKEALMGEVIKIQGNNVIIQVYEDTSGIRPGELVENTGLSLSVELGPGLLTSIYDGIQRPLTVLVEKMGNFIERGVSAPGLSHEKKWTFKPLVKSGDKQVRFSVRFRKPTSSIRSCCPRMQNRALSG